MPVFVAISGNFTNLTQGPGELFALVKLFGRIGALVFQQT
jgi:hypothetical protein